VRNEVCREGLSNKHKLGKEGIEGMFPQNGNIPLSLSRKPPRYAKEGTCGGGLQSGDSVLRFYAG
jgi:hypothetical protein